MDDTGQIKKKLSAKKFYFLYYQMTELIPLFSYLERLNFFRDSIQAMTPQGNEQESRFDNSIRLTVNKKNKSSTSEEKKSLSNDPTIDSSVKVEYLNKLEIQKQQQKTKQEEEQNWECAICLDNLSDVMLPCTHSFCDDCIKMWQAKQNNCPICRSDILTKVQTDLGFQRQDEEIYCIINSNDSLTELSEEIQMRVTGATQFIIDRKNFAKVTCTFQKIYTAEELIREGQNYKQMIQAEFS
ncbi:ring finger protein 141 [Stylonychia lemnae]|uniref:RING finger protein 141 n=1 Tax=Stylonychia lemnae TaxID=5949 RepID=A0A078AU85_STYLE|nr:ring finger protein 141 [Stylonychia lemnae]|eukprot:CDW85804.1 ring finger protein 141 [Stylonychia lemnae]